MDLQQASRRDHVSRERQMIKIGSRVFGFGDMELKLPDA
jgi:hypothetical protein